MDTENNIARNLAKVTESLREAELNAGKHRESVTLVAISKTQPKNLVKKALVAGHRIFGENTVQEAREKWPSLREETGVIELHLVGALQSNKAGKAVELFDVIETVDRRNLAVALAKNMDKSGYRPECFVQVNTGEEPQKAGVLPNEADEFIKACKEEYELPITGLMCVPPMIEEPSPHFLFLGQIAHRNGLNKLSMGMSVDYKTAIQFGATHVRVGTAIFGPRKPA